MITWTKEEIATRSTEAVRNLRNNAARLGQQQVVFLCDEELLRRKRQNLKKPKTNKEDQAGFFVSEFHFVCPNELGVTRNSDGTLSSGTWVVSVENAMAAEKYGSLVALHTTKSEPSYMQGTVKGWRQRPREDRYSGEQVTKNKSGIEFVLEPTSASLVWQGDASGEKGYAWSPISE